METPGDGTDSRAAGSDPIAKALSIVRAHFDMQVAFIAEIDGEDEVYRWVDEDTDTFGSRLGDRLELRDSFCQRLARGAIDAVATDIQDLAALGELPPTGELRVGSYAGFPIRFSDGHLYGVLCCLSVERQPDLHEKNLDLVEALAAMVSGELERRRLTTEQVARRLEAAGSEALVAALDARDGYTAEHSDAVVVLAMQVARSLFLDEGESRAVRQVALLHDIGKIGIPDHILRKPGPLDEREWRLMREHPVVGARIVGSIAGLRHLATSIRAEHERWDGNGYPDGLVGESIPLLSRIVFVCDAYHAMISDRPYRKAMGHAAALEQLLEGSGSQFDPALVAALQDALMGQPTIDLAESTTNIRVVLVDDDANTRLLLRFTLEADGNFEIAGEAADGAEALALVQTQQPDAMVLDLSMPGRGGLEVLPVLRKASPKTKILVYSAMDAPNVLQKATTLGADFCLGKGESLTQVAEALLELCASSATGASILHRPT